MTDQDPLIGATVAHYEIETFLGGGAMGRVYRCRHSRLHHRLFALKVLRGDLAVTMAMRLRFTQEAEAASQLVHPNVVSVVDFGRTPEGLLYLAMDLVEGEPLSSIIAKGALAPSRTLRLAREICLGLAHAHDLGFVHRDLKPDNIIVVRDGDRESPRIVDFGLAIHADPNTDSARLTTAGMFVGTPTYAAPEQMSSRDVVDLRADLFALGVTMFEMLAGRPPFEGDMLETLHFNATGERPTIASRAPEVAVPPRLEALVHRMMEPSVAQRVASTREVLDELDAIERDLAMPVSVPFDADQSVTITAAPPRRRDKRAVAALGVGGALIAAVVLWRASTREEPVAVAAPVSLGLAPVAPRTDPLVKPVAFAGPASSKPPSEPVEIKPPSEPVEIKPPSEPVEIEPPDPHPARRRIPKPRIARPPTTPVPIVPDTRVAEVVPRPDPIVERTLPPGEPGLDKRDHVPPGEPRITAPALTPVPNPPVLDHPPKPAIVRTSAHVTLGKLSVRGALTSAQVKRALARVTPGLRACYAASATAARTSPTLTVRASFAIDESQRARSIQSAGDTFAGIRTCVDRVLAGVRTEAAPDVGTVDVALTMTFTPEGP